MGLHGSVKQKLLLMISALILLSVLLVTALSYSSYRRDLIDQSTRTTQLLLDQLALNVDTYLDELFRLCLSPYYNKGVMGQLETTPASPAAKLQKQRVVEDYLSEVMMLPRSDILRAHILTDGVYSSSKTRYDANIPADFKGESWYQEAVESAGAVFVPVHVERQGKTELTVFSVAHRLLSTRDSGRVLGVIRVDANYQGIRAVCDRASVGEGNALLILDSAGNVIYKNARMVTASAGQNLTGLIDRHGGESTFTERLGREECLINVKPLNATDWKLVDIHAMRSLTAAAVKTRNEAFLLALLCAALGVLCSVLLVRLFLRPVYEITGLMRRVRDGDLTVRANVGGHDELAYLGDSFNEMTERVDTAMKRNTLLTRQVYEARYLEKEAQYAALCNQIRPHFLFNALNTVALLNKTGRPEEATLCIDMLATLLRGMVNTDREITLSAEMRIVESYLALQQKRYDTLSYELPELGALSGYVLPAMTLQPLVENALVHGCEPKRGQAHIAIGFGWEDEILCITVRDNGVGMEPEALERMKRLLAEDTVEPDGAPAGGVGLVNISRRIRLKYGLGYGVSIQSEPWVGTTATLRLPKEGTADVQGADRRG